MTIEGKDVRRYIHILRRSEGKRVRHS